MQSLYFIFFCVLIAYVIYWCLRNDDLADFTDEEDAGSDKKFRPTDTSQSRDAPKSAK